MLNTLTDIAAGLETLGYEAIVTNASVATKVGSADNPMTALMTIDSTNNLTITCQIATASQINDPDGTFAAMALDANTRLAPYALGIITANDSADADEDIPIVLIDKVPLGDFSISELTTAMDALLEAIMSIRTEFADFLAA